MVSLFAAIIAGCVILLIIGTIIWYDIDLTKETRDLGSALMAGGVFGGVAVYLIKKFRIYNFR